MSSDLFLTRSQLLARHRRQMVLLVVRDVAFPHDEDDLQPLRAQRSERLTMRVFPRALLIVIRSCLRTREQREERYLINDVSQRLVASEAELDDALLLAASLGHGHGAGVRLQMPKRLHRPGASPRRAQSVGAVMGVRQPPIWPGQSRGCHSSFVPGRPP
jgi:hypothetical protein